MRTASVLLLGFLAACGTPGRNVEVALPTARAPSTAERVRADVGGLLSGDPVRSRDAMERLRRLDEAGVAALLAHARTIPLERDPRWLHVLDENHALPPLPPDEEIDFLLWKAARDDPYDVMKAQGRLLELARADPGPLLDRLEQGGPETEPLAVALALSGNLRALPPLLARYRAATSPSERQALVEAITLLVGEDLRPPTQGSPASIERAAAGIERWLATQEGATPDG